MNLKSQLPSKKIKDRLEWHFKRGHEKMLNWLKKLLCRLFDLEDSALRKELEIQKANDVSPENIESH